MNEVAFTQPNLPTGLKTLNVSPPPATELNFKVVETMLCEDGIRFQALHLDRMAASALYFGIPFQRADADALVKRHLKALTQGIGFEVCLRLAVNGALDIRSHVYMPAKRCGLVRMADEVTFSADVFRSHQTTRRKIYDRLLPVAHIAGLDDFLFCNDRGELTEGTVHSVFIKRGKALLTPPLSCGVLPGVYRRFVLETHPRAQETVLRTADLQEAEALYLTSSMVGMYPVELVG